MNQYDSHHYRFYRTDPTGRHSPLYVREDAPEPWWLAVIGGVVMGCFLALTLYLAAVV